MVDLHVHSNCSDGSFSPEELVDLAREKGLSAFALTDHDTILGLTPARSYLARLSEEEPDAALPELIPGIELSTEYQGRDIHIVGLFINEKDEKFLTYLKEFVASRDARNRKMCALMEERGIDITYEKLIEEFPGRVITRAHYAKYLLGHGYVQSMNEAFDRYIGDRAPCFVPRSKVTPAQAVELILSAGGLPILAHPTLYRMSDERLEKLIRELTDYGLVGIEGLYCTYTRGEERQMHSLARQFGLLISGGSDFHGTNKPGLDLGCGYGKLNIPDEVLEKLKEAYTNTRGRA